MGRPGSLMRLARRLTAATTGGIPRPPVATQEASTHHSDLGFTPRLKAEWRPASFREARGVSPRCPQTGHQVPTIVTSHALEPRGTRAFGSRATRENTLVVRSSARNLRAISVINLGDGRFPTVTRGGSSTCRSGLHPVNGFVNATRRHRPNQERPGSRGETGSWRLPRSARPGGTVWDVWDARRAAHNPTTSLSSGGARQPDPPDWLARTCSIARDSDLAVRWYAAIKSSSVDVPDHAQAVPAACPIGR